jgi:hypothetical protein
MKTLNQKAVNLHTQNVGFILQKIQLKFRDSNRICNSDRILGATDMGTPTRGHGISTPGLYSGESHEDSKGHPKTSLYKEKPI